MEADLSRYHGIDYRDRWRRDEHGRARLTLRMIAVRLRWLPDDAATVRAQSDDPVWQLEHVLLADLWGAFTGKPHPLLADARRHRRREVTPERRRALSAARARARARRVAIAEGRIT